MRFALASALKDLRRLRRDPIALLIWLGIPAIVSLLLSLVLGGGSPAPHGLLLVADEDGTFVSSLVISTFGRGPLAKMVSIERVKRIDGRARIDRGDASALLVIPKGLEQAYVSQQPFQLALVKNPARQIIPSLIEETLATLTDAGFYVQQLTGDQLAILAKDAGRTPDAARIRNEAVQHIASRVRKLIDVPLIALKTTVVAEPTRPALNYGLLLFHGMVFMAVLFLTAGLAGGIWKERTQGALRRLAASPASVMGYLAGKSLAVCAVLTAVGVAGLVAGRWLAHAPLHDPVLALIWVVSSGAAMFLWLLLLQTAASSERAAHLLVNMMTLPLIMLGGSLFPFEAMPGSFALIGRFTPNGWALTEYKSILAGSIGGGRLALDFLGVWAAVLIALWFSARRLRSKFLV